MDLRKNPVDEGLRGQRRTQEQEKAGSRRILCSTGYLTRSIEAQGYKERACFDARRRYDHFTRFPTQTDYDRQSAKFTRAHGCLQPLSLHHTRIFKPREHASTV